MDPHSVFKAYDIRGRTDNGEVDSELFRLVGGAFVALVETEAIGVGRDCRESSAGLFDALVASARASGIEEFRFSIQPWNRDVVRMFPGVDVILDMVGAPYFASNVELLALRSGERSECW